MNPKKHRFFNLEINQVLRLIRFLNYPGYISESKTLFFDNSGGRLNSFPEERDNPK